MKLRAILILVLAMAVSACGGRDRDITLSRIKNTGNGPEEFNIVPGKPLQAPESYRALPAPTPGGTNITDPTPKGDSVAALGGNPGALANTGIGRRDGGLVNYANRFGVVPGIRQTLAREDVEIRRKRGRVNILNIGRNDDYNLAYRRQWLDSKAEATRLRRVGVPTPSYPPEGRRR
ncbi:hypothetical protein FIU86_00035 [Roseovarius sp. THAF9]|uniref:DUF3035 domain-containing protein n=1 Tax=Roseovarius sp. THAF9 TaxID=2587847 RepID=UPI0012692FC7|nr:DUF3035 domain-containing protein [Roseovarius sp. THAF9]QFT91213.1 hypothetical protein FIU86_00035 [Roseovarius sp. THAF9]